MPRRPPPRVSYLLARPSMALSCLSPPPPPPAIGLCGGGGVDALTRKRAHSEWKGVPPPAICDGGALSVASVGDSISLLLPPWPGRYSALHFDDTTLPKEGGEIPPPRGCWVLCKPTRLYSCIAN